MQGFLLRITTALMYNLRRLFCKLYKSIFDKKEMKPFQTKLNVSPRMGARGARPEAGLFSYLCGQSSLAKQPSWHLKHMSAITSLVLFSLPLVSRENLWASLNVTLSASLVPHWHENEVLSEYKEGPYWMAAIAQRERQLSAFLFPALSLICSNCQK